ncbi:MAG: chorismate mutase [Peptococcaceae bacterium]|nr:chorismate mutase [Peptococcaceae bacterium]
MHLGGSSLAGTVLRGIRGAITVERNSAEEILAATGELLDTIIKENDIEAGDMASIIFTMTEDLDACFPARAARDRGLKYVPLLDALELNVPGSLPRCIRILIHVNTNKSQKEIKHVYLGEAACLRPDIKQS